MATFACALILPLFHAIIVGRPAFYSVGAFRYSTFALSDYVYIVLVLHNLLGCDLCAIEWRALSDYATIADYIAAGTRALPETAIAHANAYVSIPYTPHLTRNARQRASTCIAVP
jgi:hypothetical protein